MCVKTVESSLFQKFKNDVLNVLFHGHPCDFHILSANCAGDVNTTRCEYGERDRVWIEHFRFAVVSELHIVSQCML